MFQLHPAPTFNAKVKLTVPGQETPAEVDFTFKHKTRTAIDDWTDRLSTERDPGKEAPLLMEVIAGWGVGNDLSEANLATLLDNYPASGGELVRGYLRAITESRAKN